MKILSLLLSFCLFSMDFFTETTFPMVRFGILSDTAPVVESIVIPKSEEQIAYDELFSLANDVIEALEEEELEMNANLNVTKFLDQSSEQALKEFYEDPDVMAVIDSLAESDTQMDDVLGEEQIVNGFFREFGIDEGCPKT